MGTARNITQSPLLENARIERERHAAMRKVLRRLHTWATPDEIETMLQEVLVTERVARSREAL